jgi:3-hydroxyisobutyrate dehydrogenase-like beta-hydroxyacid dehydrogenase
MSQMQTVGFIGLGGMGRGLVKNVALKGVDVRVMDRRPEAVADVAQFGAKPADSLEALRRDCPVIMVCINTAEDTEKLVLGPGGLCDLAGPDDFVLVDHTTSNPGAVERLSAALAQRGFAYAEAPMTRTPKHADAGIVNVLYAGDAELLGRLRPYFETYAENIFHIGPSGHAIRLKLIHNFIAFANVLSWCEGFALAAKEGLDLDQAIAIISAAGGKSGMLDLYGDATLNRDFTPWMSLANAAKDVRYYAEWIEKAGLPGFYAEAVSQSYRMAELEGHAQEGCTSVIKFYERVTGVEARIGAAANDG